jgi:hypothetical protein
MKWKLAKQSVPTDDSDIVVDLADLGTPQAAYFLMGRGKTDASIVSDASLSIGATDASGNQWCVAINAKDGIDVAADGGDTQTVTTAKTEGACALITTEASGVRGQAGFKEVAEDSITLSSTAGSGFNDTFILNSLGINECTNVAVGSQYITNGADSGTGSTTDFDIGFTPKVVLWVIEATDISYYGSENIVTSHGIISLETSENKAVSVPMFNKDHTSLTKAEITQGLYTSSVKVRSSGVYPEFSVSDITDGFRLTKIDGYGPDSNSITLHYLALDFDNDYKLDFTYVPPLSSTHVVEGLGFDPDGLMVLGANVVSSTHMYPPSNKVNSTYEYAPAGKASIGLATSALQRSIGYTTEDNATTTSSTSVTNETFLELRGVAGADYYSAEVSSFDSDGYTLDFKLPYPDTFRVAGLVVPFLAIGDVTPTPAPDPDPDPPEPEPDIPSSIPSVISTTTSFTDAGISTTWDSSAITSRSSQYPTREGDVRRKIFKMTQAKHNISFIYKESLRAMIASFNDIGYFDGEDKFIDIKCIHGNPERTIAKLKQETNIILPILSISQTMTANDDDRRRYESVLVHEKYWDAEKYRAIRVLSLAPRPVNINYKLNVWAKYAADMDQILEQVRLKFNPELEVPTPNSTLTKAFLESEDDIGSYEAGDKEDRILKKAFNIILRTYIPSPKFLITSTGKIEEVKIPTEPC